MKTYILLDCPFLCYRAFHTSGKLAEGTIYGFMQSLYAVYEYLGNNNFVFCWDSNKSLREKIRPDYKQERRKKYVDNKETIEFRRQMYSLQDHVIYKLGYHNNFRQTGYEADDLIASICQEYNKHQFIIVSADHDLYQCLGDRVMLYKIHQKRLYTQHDLKREFKVTPEQWHLVKSIAGCKSDGIAGVKGVGEVTAAKWLNKQLKPGVHFKKIEDQQKLWNDNIPLVQLPFEGCNPPAIVEDEATADKWRAFCEKMKFNTLIRRYPG